jgi:hypothetical protein
MENQMKNQMKNDICIIAGMPRAATTFLYYTLPKHPSVYVPKRKETEFFSLNRYRGTDWYLDFFKDMQDGQIGFDISPMYFLDPESPRRIIDFDPNMKVILMVRHPAEWIVSFFKNRQAAEFKKLDFKKFLDGHEYEKDGRVLKLEFKNDAVKRSIGHYMDLMGRNLLLIHFKLFTDSPLSVLQAIEKFISIPHFFNDHNFENVKINASDQKSNKIINRLMHSKLFADLVVKIFPKNLIMSIRYRSQVSTAGKDKTPFNNEENNQDLDLAKETLKNDITFISDLFRESLVLYGSGEAFDYSL